MPHNYLTNLALKIIASQANELKSNKLKIVQFTNATCTINVTDQMDISEGQKLKENNS